MQSSFLLIVLFLFVVFNSPSTHMYSKSGTLLCPCTMVCWYRRQKERDRGIGWMWWAWGVVGNASRCMHRMLGWFIFVVVWGGGWARCAIPFTNSHREGSQYHRGAEPHPNQRMENSDEWGREMIQSQPAVGCYADHIKMVWSVSFGLGTTSECEHRKVGDRHKRWCIEQQCTRLAMRQCKAVYKSLRI